MSEDRIEIEALLYRYCEVVDLARIDDVVALFTADGTVDYGNGRLVQGATELGKFFADRVGSYTATSHHSSNVAITFGDSPDAATATSSIYAWHQQPDGNQIEIWGRYLDDIVRDPDGWRLQTRKIRAAGWRGFSIPEGTPAPFEKINRETLR